MKWHHYDPELRTKLKPESSHPFALNPYFYDCLHEIEVNIADRGSGDSHYQRREAKKLLQKAKRHIEDNKKPVTQKRVVAITHPFYLHTSHMQFVSDDIRRKDSDNYLNSLMRLLNNRPEDVGIIVLETLHHYCAVTSVLAEQGLIDQVVLTRFDSGMIFDNSQLEVMKDKSVFVCGGYDSFCLSQSTYALAELNPITNMRVLFELVIDSPRILKRRIRPDKNRCLEGFGLKGISLDELLGHVTAA